MGVFCSRASPASRESLNPTDKAKIAMANNGSHHHVLRSQQGDKDAARRLVSAHDANIYALKSDRSVASWRTVSDKCTPNRQDSDSSNGVSEYLKSRNELLNIEETMNFDYACRSRASPLEHQVDDIIRQLRMDDDEQLFKTAKPRLDKPHGQQHPRFAGDHFLGNRDLINKSRVFEIARRMPKGGHLHIHFNACLLPHVLLDIAKSMDRMFITSTLPLTNPGQRNDCEIQFSIISPDKERPGDLFAPDYQSGQTMRFKDFLARFPSLEETADAWLVRKIVFQESEAHNVFQTAAGAWEKFNGRTRMMKGLFNYETAYRQYTRLCLDDFLRDNIQYAEIRPNFMTSNQLYRDDGSGLIDNAGIMEIIIDEVQQFQKQTNASGRYFGGLKVIYCTPRSFEPSDVATALQECLRFKQKWPQWIAGFDLVGEEARGRPIGDFVPQLLNFRRECDQRGLDIPFLFHCGETTEIGTTTDHNLIDALLLNSKRIGHGFALKHHPYIMEQMKARGICLELCPISNEILGLTPRVGGHAMYSLLANNVHCTVNSDNGTMFRSTLSHDFYQVMIGKSNMGLFGWKQLILWSLEHACLGDEEYTDVMSNWETLWLQFLQAVVKEHEHQPAQSANRC